MLDQKPQHPAAVIGYADITLLIALTVGIDNLYKVSAICKIFADTISIRFPYSAAHKLLYDRKLWSKATVSYAARNGHLEVLQWLMTENCPWDAKACTIAAKYGNLEVLQWLRTKNCQWDAKACAYAAQNGHLIVLQWLRANGCDWCPRTCSNAARSGHLEVLQWARNNGCDWRYEHICNTAAAYGKLEVLQWLVDEKCALSTKTWRLADQNGRHEVRNWLEANGCQE
jgi:hypothetical protein